MALKCAQAYTEAGSPTGAKTLAAQFRPPNSSADRRAGLPCVFDSGLVSSIRLPRAEHAGCLIPILETEPAHARHAARPTKRRNTVRNTRSHKKDVRHSGHRAKSRPRQFSRSDKFDKEIESYPYTRNACL